MAYFNVNGVSVLFRLFVANDCVRMDDAIDLRVHCWGGLVTSRVCCHEEDRDFYTYCIANFIRIERKWADDQALIVQINIRTTNDWCLFGNWGEFGMTGRNASEREGIERGCGREIRLT